MVTKTKVDLENKCKRALIEVTSNMKEIKKRLQEIENIQRDINDKTSYILETLSVENIRREYIGLKQFFDDTIGEE